MKTSEVVLSFLSLSLCSKLFITISSFLPPETEQQQLPLFCCPDQSLDSVLLALCIPCLSVSQFHSARQWFDSCACVNETTRIYVKPCFSFSLLFYSRHPRGETLSSLTTCMWDTFFQSRTSPKYLPLCFFLSVFDTWMRLFPNVVPVYWCSWREESDCSPTSAEHLASCVIRKKEKKL